MQIRKNTKAYKTILEILTKCQGRPDREKLVRLYITRAGNSINERINVEGIQGGDAGLFYDMTYETVLNNLQSSNHQLIASDEVPGIYYFHSTSNKVWDEAPFEFDEAIRKEFSSLAELPAVRKKEKARQFNLTDARKKSDASQHKPKKSETVKPTVKPTKSRDQKPRGPDFKLKHEIDFTNLDRIIFRQSKLSKQDVLEYYNKIAAYILPYLKDRPLKTRRDVESQKPSIEMSAAALFPGDEGELPDWIRRHAINQGKLSNELLLCNDKEHMLFYIETGSIAFDHGLSKIKTPNAPDNLLIAIDSPEFEISKAVDVALIAKEVFDGLQLRASIKTDGLSGLHVYFPLEPGCTFDTSFRIAEYICKLIRLKRPDLVSLNETDEQVYGKVSLDYSLNAPGKSVVAPYSLVAGQSAVVATPLLWEEVTEGLRLEDFNHETIFKRLNQLGDLLEGVRKRINSDALLERLETHYAFLL